MSSLTAGILVVVDVVAVVVTAVVIATASVGSGIDDDAANVDADDDTSLSFDDVADV